MEKITQFFSNTFSKTGSWVAGGLIGLVAMLFSGGGLGGLAIAAGAGLVGALALGNTADDLLGKLGAAGGSRLPAVVGGKVLEHAFEQKTVKIGDKEHTINVPAPEKIDRAFLGGKTPAKYIEEIEKDRLRIYNGSPQRAYSQEMNGLYSKIAERDKPLSDYLATVWKYKENIESHNKLQESVPAAQRSAKIDIPANMDWKLSDKLEKFGRNVSGRPQEEWNKLNPLEKLNIAQNGAFDELAQFARHNDVTSWDSNIPGIGRGWGGNNLNKGYVIDAVNAYVRGKKDIDWLDAELKRLDGKNQAGTVFSENTEALEAVKRAQRFAELERYRMEAQKARIDFAAAAQEFEKKQVLEFRTGITKPVASAARPMEDILAQSTRAATSAPLLEDVSPTDSLTPNAPTVAKADDKKKNPLIQDSGTGVSA